MQRLIGIGVSPGIVSGRAVILIQRASGAALPDRRGAARHRARTAREEPRALAAAAGRHPRARGAPAARAGDDVRRAAADARRPDARLARRRHRARAARERRVGRAAGLPRVQLRVRRDRGSVPPRAEGRAVGSRRAAQDEPAAGRGHAPRPPARPGRVVGHHRRRAHAVARGAGGLDQGPRLCHRRRQPDVPHRDPRAIARSARGRRPAQRERDRSGRSARGDRRHGERGDRRSDPRRPRARGARRGPPAGASAATPSGGVRRRPPTAFAFASRPTSSFPTIWRPPATRAPRASACIDRSSC